MKKTSYQKLKEENDQLKNDIYILVEQKDYHSELYYKTWIKYKIKFDIDKLIWLGSYENKAIH